MGKKERYYVHRYFKKDIKREAEIAVVTSRPKKLADNLYFKNM
jgi:hypothetical protein